MEHIINALDVSNNINIIGNNNDVQVLQKVLKKYDSITVNSNYISYTSSSNLEEIPYNDNNNNNNTTTSSSSLLKNSNFLRLKNNSDNFEYIGLSNNQGRILKILPLLYNDLCIRVDSVLAFAETVDLIEDKALQNVINTHFNTTQQHVNLHFKMKTTMNNTFCVVKGKNDKPLNNMQCDNDNDIKEGVIALKRDYMYLTCNGGVIEKRLGDNEQIVIMKSGLLAFEKSVTFYDVDNKKVTYVNKVEDIIIEGPGLVIFHTYNRMNKTMPKGMVVSLIITFVMLVSFEFITHMMMNLPVE